MTFGRYNPIQSCHVLDYENIILLNTMWCNTVIIMGRFYPFYISFQMAFYWNLNTSMQQTHQTTCTQTILHPEYMLHTTVFSTVTVLTPDPQSTNLEFRNNPPMQCIDWILTELVANNPRTMCICMHINQVLPIHKTGLLTTKVCYT